MKKVAIIVVTYNRLSLLKECIQSLRNQTYDDTSIIVINNGSTDDTYKWLAEQNDIVTINQSNTGGAGGFFTGIKYACENGFEYTWIMDDDVEAKADTLEKLMKHTPKTQGFLCSRVLDINGCQCNVPRISNRKSEETGEWTWGNELDSNLLEVLTTSFVSVLLPTKIVYQLGLPYKDYFIWGDDTEYTTRISNTYKSFLVIDSIMTHKRIQNNVLSIFTENNPHRVRMYYYSYRNRIHNSKGALRKIAFFILGLADFLKLTLKGNFKKAKVVIKGNLAALIFNPKTIFPK